MTEEEYAQLQLRDKTIQDPALAGAVPLCDD